MNKISHNFQGNNIEDNCKCGQELTNIHLYECTILNNSNKTAEFLKLFDGRLCEMKYIAGILEQNMKEHKKFTQAQDTPPLSH